MIWPRMLGKVKTLYDSMDGASDEISRVSTIVLVDGAASMPSGSIT